MASSKQARAGGGSPGKPGRAGGAGGPAAAQRGRQAGKGAGSRPATAGAGAAARGGKAAQRGSAARQRQPADTGPAAEIKAKPASGGGPRWLPLSTFILSLAGLGLSVYLTITHYTDTVLAGCPVNATINCTKVTTSPESFVLGIPVAVLGLAFYVFMVAVNSPWAWRANRPEIRWSRLAGVVTGIVFVLYLVYAELFKIDAICEYCTGVHIITFILFGLVMYNFATWTAPAGKAASR